jgi:alcohol dehydrogenase
MKALAYLGPAKSALEERPKPEITAPTGAVVKKTKTTICGTDLHILKGDVPSRQPVYATSFSLASGDLN